MGLGDDQKFELPITQAELADALGGTSMPLFPHFGQAQAWMEERFR